MEPFSDLFQVAHLPFLFFYKDSIYNQQPFRPVSNTKFSVSVLYTGAGRYM